MEKWLILMKNAKRRILIASFFSLLLILIPFSTIARDSNVISEEEIEDTVRQGIINPETITNEQAFFYLDTALGMLSQEYSDDLEIIGTINSIQQELIVFSEPNEGALEKTSTFCALLLFLVILNAARVLGVAVEEVVGLIQGFGGFEYWLINFVMKLRYGFAALFLGLVYLSVCGVDEGGASPIEINGDLNLEYIKTKTYECG